MSEISKRCMRGMATALTVVAFWALSVQPALATTGLDAGGRVVVALSRNASAAQAEAAIRAAAGTVIHAVPSTHALLLRVARGSETAIAARLALMPGVRFAEPDRRVRAQEIPNDSLYSLQWGLAAVDAPIAFDGARGSSAVKVAVIDSGVYFGHPDLAGVLDSTHDYDYVNSDDDASDDNGHGTHVTGIIAALTNNRLGVASLAGFGPNGVVGGVRVVPFKVLDENGDGWDEDVALAVRRAADAGARVINLSMGGPGSTSLSEAVAYAHAKGCVLVAAAGNSGLDQVLYPAGSPGVVGVGSVDSELRQALFSNSGAHVDVVAPGEQVFSTSWPQGAGSGGDLYGYMSGTSMATPMVAAEAALLFSAMPTATNTKIENAIMSSARDLGPVGWDDDYGRGMIDVAAALGKLIGFDYTPPVTVASGFSEGWNAGDVAVTLKATDDLSGVASVEYVVGDGPLVDYAAPFTVTSEGVTKIAFSSVDKAGNREQTRVATIRIDRTPPVTSTDLAQAYVGSARITLYPSDTLSGVASKSWVLDGVESSGTVVTTSGYGLHTLAYWATDAAGNTEERHSAAFFVLNQAGEVPPLTTVAMGVSNGWSSTPATVSLVSLGGNGYLARTIWYSLDGMSANRYTAPLVVTKEGTSTLDYWSWDGGTAESVKHATVRVDRRPPTLSVSSPPVASDSAIVSAAATDSGSGINEDSLAWSIDGGLMWMRGLTAAIVDPGHFDVLFRAADLAGNETRATAKITITSGSEIMLAPPTVVAPAWGSSVALLGGVSPAPSSAETVTIQARPHGTSRWLVVARVRTDATGAFSVRVTPRVRTEYRALFAGNDVLRAAAPSGAVVLKPRVSLTPASGVLARTSSGVRLRLSGRIVPAHTRGVYLVAERRATSGWTSRRSLPVALVGDGHGGSTWSASLALPRGMWRIRMYHPGDILHSATYSAVRYVTVR